MDGLHNSKSDFEICNRKTVQKSNMRILLKKKKTIKNQASNIPFHSCNKPIKTNHWHGQHHCWVKEEEQQQQWAAQASAWLWSGVQRLLVVQTQLSPLHTWSAWLSNQRNSSRQGHTVAETRTHSRAHTDSKTWWKKRHWSNKYILWTQKIPSAEIL